MRYGKALSVGLCLGLLLSGCNGEDTGGAEATNTASELSDAPSVAVSFEDTQAQRDLNDNIALWKIANMSDYQYSYAVHIPVPNSRTVMVQVRSSKITEAFYTPSGTFLTREEIDAVNTVDALFEVIQEGLNRVNTDERWSVEVTYNEHYGYPESIFIGQDGCAQDTCVTYTVMEFQ